MKLEMFGNSLKLVLVEGTAGLYKISGTAIHPCKTFHPHEWGKVRQYIEPYLERAAPTLVTARMVIDHKPSTMLSAPNKITLSLYKNGELYYEGLITEQIYRMFKNGVLKPKVSVGVDWMKPGGGIIVGEEGGEPVFFPYGFDFSEFSFLTQEMNPGDPEANLKIWEGVLKEAQNAQSQAVVEPQDFIFYPIRDLSVFMLGHFKVEWVDREQGVQAFLGRLIEKPESYQPFALLFMKAAGWTEQSIDTWLLAKPQYSRSALAPPPTGVESPLIEVVSPSKWELRAKERIQLLGVCRQFQRQMMEEPVKRPLMESKAQPEKRVVGVFGYKGGVVGGSGGIVTGAVDSIERGTVYQAKNEPKTRGVGELENPFTSEVALDPIDRLRRLLHEV